MFAPSAPAEPALARPGDLEKCLDLLRVGSRSFHAASRLLPRRLREPAAALYAFCRVADDEIDLTDDPAARLAALRERLARAYAGDPAAHAIDRTLADVVAHHAIPIAIPQALIEGFAWDAEGRRYGDLAALEAYATRVAGTVGVMMALLMGVRAPATLARACDLGIAMQLTNIARDIGEDARNGRLYLPLDWLADEGIDAEAFLRAPRFDERLARIVARLLDRANLLYARAQIGIADLPGDCRHAIRSAGLIYAGIGRKLVREGADPVATRVVVSRGEKLRLIAAALVPARIDRADAAAPPVAAARFLIDAVAAAPTRGAVAPIIRSFGERAAWVLELVGELDNLDRRQAEAARPQP